jgi:hypothetical protein
VVQHAETLISFEVIKAKTSFSEKSARNEEEEKQGGCMSRRPLKFESDQVRRQAVCDERQTARISLTQLLVYK